MKRRIPDVDVLAFQFSQFENQGVPAVRKIWISTPLGLGSCCRQICGKARLSTVWHLGGGQKVGVLCNSEAFRIKFSRAIFFFTGN